MFSMHYVCYVCSLGDATLATLTCRKICEKRKVLWESL